MLNLSTSTARTDAVRTIGKGVRATDECVAEIVASLPDGFDVKARGAVAGAVHLWAAGGDADAKRPAVTTGGKGAQSPTDYGTGVDTLTRAVKRALSATGEKPVTLRAVLSGEGGGSTTIPTDHPLYAAIVALIGAGTDDESTDDDA